MLRRWPFALLLLLLAVPAFAAPGTPKPSARTAVATFAMGCFWSGEVQYEQRPGVLSVVSGYTGGRKDNPTYEEVSEGDTGHYESVQVTYDPARVSYEQLLELFWHGIDPTQADGQFCDRAPEYRSVIFVHDDAQRRAAEASKLAIEKSGVLKAPIVTQILPAARFWPAEDYHQDFYKKSSAHYHAYRMGCRRDARLRQVWGDLAALPVAPH